ncbi:50S ribosomal protein L35ae [Candidatus Woesearchaeota archaeon]|nr:50S ribosomal protein L35ae [Candidatus Woesearchaeota archaeon]
MVEGIINNFKIGRHTKSSNQMIVIVPTVTSKEDAGKFVGKQVTFTTDGGRKISGEIKSSHGNKGALRVAFVTGMPGQAIGKKVEIQG